MVTDRSSSVLLLAHLMHHAKDIAWQEFIPALQHYAPSTSRLYLPTTLPSGIQSLIFGLLIALDISSHYMHMVASLSSGATSHKKITRAHGKNLALGEYLLSWYYESQIVLFLVCAFNEAFFLTIFFQAVPQAQFRAFLAPLRLKCDIYSYLPLTLMSTFPVFLLKQSLNLIQLKRAVAKLVQQQSAPIKRD
jgi:CDP-diacylglycerol--inositol 3-phosphatidyltransferase